MTQTVSGDLGATPRLGRKHNPTIDSVKGALILLVMIGHSFNEGVGDSPAKWLIYGFHMPVFFGLSGYLLNLASLRGNSAHAALNRYWRRLILPWIPAFVLFTALTVDDHSAHGLVNAVLRPPHHLWFVPVLCFFVAVCFLYRGSRTRLFVAATVLGVIGLLLFGVGRQAGPLDTLTLPDPRYVTMAPFFFFGMFLADRPAPRPLPMLLIALVSLAVWQLLYYYPADALGVIPYMAQNLALIAVLPALLKVRIDLPVFREVGVDSFYFYLWHPFLFTIAKHFLDRRLSEPVEFVVVPVLSLAILFVGLYLIRFSQWLCLLSGVVAPPAERVPAAEIGYNR